MAYTAHAWDRHAVAEPETLRRWLEELDAQIAATAVGYTGHTWNHHAVADTATLTAWLQAMDTAVAGLGAHIAARWTTQAGEPETLRSLLSALDTAAALGVVSGINVLDFGAVGDGSTDDTAAIQAALNSAVSGETVTLPAGHTFLVSITGSRSHNFAGLGGEFYACDVPDGVTVKVDGTLKLPYNDVGFPHSCIALMNKVSSGGFTVTGAGTIDGGATVASAEIQHWGIYVAGSGASLTVGDSLTFTGWRGKAINCLGANNGAIPLGNITIGACLIHHAGHGNGIVVAGANIVTITGTQILDSYQAGFAEALILYGPIAQLVMTNVTSTNWGNLAFSCPGTGTIGSDSLQSVVSGCSFTQPAAGTSAAFNLDTFRGTNVSFINCLADASASTVGRGFTVNGKTWRNVLIAHCTGLGGSSTAGGYKNYISPTDGGNNLVCAFTSNGTDFIQVPVSANC